MSHASSANDITIRAFIIPCRIGVEEGSIDRYSRFTALRDAAEVLNIACFIPGEDNVEGDLRMQERYRNHLRAIGFAANLERFPFADDWLVHFSICRFRHVRK